MSTEDRNDDGGAPRGAARWTVWAPLVGFGALTAVFAAQLASPSDGSLRSQFIDSPAPAIDAPALGAGGEDGDGRLTGADLATGDVTVVNFFASWCAPCRIEHIDLMRLDASGEARVIGVLYGDTPENARRYLEELGDPYVAVGLDPERRIGLDWGLEGVPETFIIDGDGHVVYRHSGPILNDDLTRVILPAVREAAAR